MIIDYRTGSGDLVQYIPKTIATLGTLQFGDASILGQGPQGRPVPVGAEIKKLSDVLQCIQDGRFAGHQLPGLLNSYEVVYLVVEGIWRSDPNSGILETWKNKGWTPAVIGREKFMADSLMAWEITMESRAGVRIRHTSSRRETAQFLVTLDRWWQKEWDSHKSHLAFDRTPGPLEPIHLVKPSVLRRVAKELPGLGWQKTLAVAGKFKTIGEMVNADVSEWQKIEGIGRVMAERIVRVIKYGD